MFQSRSVASLSDSFLFRTNFGEVFQDVDSLLGAVLLVAAQKLERRELKSLMVSKMT